MDESPAIPGYRIQRQLGRGGMATVYLAIQEKLNRPVAVKVLLPVLLSDTQFVQRFLQEAETAASLRHSNIIHIYDYGQAGHFNYIVMEYLEESLKDRIASGRVGMSDVEDIILPVSRALDYAHSQGIVHRDIKPENIMFRSDGTPVLTDFGIARAVDSASKLTKTGISIGTPHYMSPEQARGEKIDGNSDYYSLGIMLYEMLTGKLPFNADNTVAIVLKHLQEPVPRLEGQHKRYQILLESLLAKDRKERIRSAADILSILRPSPGEPVIGDVVRLPAPLPRQEEVQAPSISIIGSMEDRDVPPLPREVEVEVPKGPTARGKKLAWLSAFLVVAIVLLVIIVKDRRTEQTYIPSGGNASSRFELQQEVGSSSGSPGVVLPNRDMDEQKKSDKDALSEQQPGTSRVDTSSIPSTLSEGGREKGILDDFSLDDVGNVEYGKASEYNRKGLDYCRNQEFDSALIEFKKAAKAKGDSAEYWNNIGYAFQMLGRYEASNLFCEKALEISPGRAVAFGNIAYNLAKLGRFDEAVEKWVRYYELLRTSEKKRGRAEKFMRDQFINDPDPNVRDVLRRVLDRLGISY